METVKAQKIEHREPRESFDCLGALALPEVLSLVVCGLYAFQPKISAHVQLRAQVKTISALSKCCRQLRSVLLSHECATPSRVAALAFIRRKYKSADSDAFAFLRRVSVADGRMLELLSLPFALCTHHHLRPSAEYPSVQELSADAAASKFTARFIAAYANLAVLRSSAALMHAFGCQFRFCTAGELQGESLFRFVSSCAAAAKDADARGALPPVFEVVRVGPVVKFDFSVQLSQFHIAEGMSILRGICDAVPDRCALRYIFSEEYSAVELLSLIIHANSQRRRMKVKLSVSTHEIEHVVACFALHPERGTKLRELLEPLNVGTIVFCDGHDAYHDRMNDSVHIKWIPGGSFTPDTFVTPGVGFEDQPIAPRKLTYDLTASSDEEEEAEEIEIPSGLPDSDE
jgi:hypothetical protein